MRHKKETITEGPDLDCGISEQCVSYVESWVGGHRTERGHQAGRNFWLARNREQVRINKAPGVTERADQKEIEKTEEQGSCWDLEATIAMFILLRKLEKL